MFRLTMALWAVLAMPILANIQNMRVPSALAQPHNVSGQVILVPQDDPTIQAGIDGADDGDTVLVSSGTYYENVNFKGKGIIVRSASGPELTTIDGNSLDSVVTFSSGEDASSVIEGFTIQNGRANKGGGVYCDGSSPSIRNNKIIDNDAVGPDPPGGGGGGIYCESGSRAIIVDNAIANNSAN